MGLFLSRLGKLLSGSILGLVIANAIAKRTFLAPHGSLLRVILPYAIGVLFSKQRIAARAAAAERARAASGAPYELTIFHRVNDAHSHLLMQALPSLLRRFHVALLLRVVDDRVLPGYSPDPERQADLEAWSVRDASDLNQLYDFHLGGAGGGGPGGFSSSSCARSATQLLVAIAESTRESRASVAGAGGGRLDGASLARCIAVSKAAWDGDEAFLKQEAARQEAISTTTATVAATEAHLAAAATAHGAHHAGGILRHEASGAQYWGLDRLPLLERELLRLGLAKERGGRRRQLPGGRRGDNKITTTAAAELVVPREAGVVEFGRQERLQLLPELQGAGKLLFTQPPSPAPTQQQSLPPPSLSSSSLSSSSSSSSSPPAAAAAAAAAASEGWGLELFYSFRSPYSQLCLKRFFRLAAHYGVPWTVKPVLPMAMRGLRVPRSKGLIIMADAMRAGDEPEVGEPIRMLCDPLGKPTERAMSMWPLVVARGREQAFLQAWAALVYNGGVDAGTDRGLAQICAVAGVPWGEAAQYIQDGEGEREGEREGEGGGESKGGSGKGWRRWAEANRLELMRLRLWGVPSFRWVPPPHQHQHQHRHRHQHQESPTMTPPTPTSTPPTVTATWGQDRLWLLEDAILRSLGHPEKTKVAAAWRERQAAEPSSSSSAAAANPPTVRPAAL